ncbi:MAG TPA: undecaprenyl-diphosphate phosphatase [Candidatus Acidoferrales bacterium]|nr:undecaprenyl-diphosphate phosphatase [Candidatus Acidoferrales bacterium]
MHDYLMSVVLGIVEGLTEFLPVSSTAHLRIAEVLLHISLQSGYWKMYTIVIQIGAIATLPIYFREHIRQLLSTFPRGERGDRTIYTHPLSLVMIAFVITALPSYLLTKVIGKNLESLYVMGTALVVGGVVMWLVDLMNSKSEAAGEAAGANSRIHTWRMENMNLGQAMWIGACQVLSGVFPGTSRSMSTITAGQVAGMSRAAALEFSFFLSMPTMTTAVAYSLFKSLRGKDENPIGVAQIDAHQWVVLLIGLVVAFVVAYGAVAWFMGWVRKHGFAPFAVYRIILGAVVLYYASRIG